MNPRVVPAAHDDRRTAREDRDQGVEEIDRVAGDELVGVVDDQQERCRAFRQHPPEAAQRSRCDRHRAAKQSREDMPIDRLDGIERDRDRREENGRVVVGGVQRQPCGRPSVPFDEFGEHRRFAVPGRSGDEEHVPIVLPQPVDQSPPRDLAASGSRRVQLGAGRHEMADLLRHGEDVGHVRPRRITLRAFTASCTGPTERR